MLAQGFIRMGQTVWKSKEGTHRVWGYIPAFIFLMNRRVRWIIIIIIIIIIPIPLRHDPWPWFPPFSSSSYSCLPAVRQFFLFSNLTVFIRTSLFHLYLDFPVDLLPAKILFSVFVQGFFLPDIHSTCTAHFNFLTRMYTLFNKNQAAWNFLRPEMEVTWRRVAIIIWVVLLSPYLCIRVVSLSSIHYNQSHRIY